MKNRLKWFLKLQNMTQKDLSVACNLTQAGVSRYANGERVPNAIIAIKIAKALNVSVEDIWG